MRPCVRYFNVDNECGHDPCVRHFLVVSGYSSGWVVKHNNSCDSGTVEFEQKNEMRSKKDKNHRANRFLNKFDVRNFAVMEYTPSSIRVDGALI